MGTRADINREIAENLARFHLLDAMNEPTATLPTASSACSKLRSLFLQSGGSCYWMNRPQAFPKVKGTIS
jgi:hypothetical protein